MRINNERYIDKKYLMEFYLFYFFGKGCLGLYLLSIPEAAAVCVRIVFESLVMVTALLLVQVESPLFHSANEERPDASCVFCSLFTLFYAGSRESTSLSVGYTFADNIPVVV